MIHLISRCPCVVVSDCPAHGAAFADLLACLHSAREASHFRHTAQQTQTQVALLVAAALQVAARTPLTAAFSSASSSSSSSSSSANGNDGIDGTSSSSGSVHLSVRAGLTTPASAAAAVAAATDRRKRAELAAAAAAARKIKAAAAAAAAAAKAASSASSSASSGPISAAEAPLSEVRCLMNQSLCHPSRANISNHDIICHPTQDIGSDRVSAIILCCINILCKYCLNALYISVNLLLFASSATFQHPALRTGHTRAAAPLWSHRRHAGRHFAHQPRRTDSVGLRRALGQWRRRLHVRGASAAEQSES
jgi:hypothetical protein